MELPLSQSSLSFELGGVVILLKAHRCQGEQRNLNKVVILLGRGRRGDIQPEYLVLPEVVYLFSHGVSVHEMVCYERVFNTI